MEAAVTVSRAGAELVVSRGEVGVPGPYHWRPRPGHRTLGERRARAAGVADECGNLCGEGGGALVEPGQELLGECDLAVGGDGLLAAAACWSAPARAA